MSARPLFTKTNKKNNQLGLFSRFANRTGYWEMIWTRPLSFIPRFWALLENRNAAPEFKWLTAASPEAPDDTQLAHEPNDNPAAKACQKANLTREFPQRHSLLMRFKKSTQE
jgi:hypothetical protein